MHPRGITGWILRTLELVWGIIVLAMAAALVANQPSGGSPSQINYSVFVGVFSLLSWFYTVGATQVSPDGLGSPIIVVILDSLNLLFYFCGGVAMAVALKVHSCGNVAYVMTNGITAGSTQRCHEGQTLTAFLWFGIRPPTRLLGLIGVGFFTYLVSAILTGVMSGGSMSMRRGGGGVIPQMSTV
jgi:non-classical export protein 2